MTLEFDLATSMFHRISAGERRGLLFRGPLGSFLYKSERAGETPMGSQLSHADGGPETCINVMFR